MLALSDAIYERVRRVISGLYRNPRPADSRKLKGRDDAWRIRVGDYRVVYVIDDSEKTVTVFRASHGARGRAPSLRFPSAWEGRRPRRPGIIQAPHGARGRAPSHLPLANTHRV